MRVLVVEDEPELAAFLTRTLREVAWAPDSVTTGHAALEALAVNEYDLVILDLGLPDLEGFEVCRRWRAQGGRTPILMLTARDVLADRVRGLDAGADDYLPKPFSATHFEILMGRAAHAVVVAREKAKNGAAVKDPSESHSDQVRIYGRSAALRQVLDVASRVAQTDASVFITGESGTGKEVIAQYIHLHSRRRTRELIADVLATVPDRLEPAERFPGHVTKSAGRLTGPALPSRTSPAPRRWQPATAPGARPSRLS